MKLTERERRLLPFLPAVAVLLGYAWWFTVVQRPKMRTIQAEYRQAVAKQVHTGDLVRRQGEVKALENEVAALDRTKKDLDQSVARMTGTKPASLRHAHNAALNELLDRHHLKLIEELPVSKGGDAKLPKSVKDVLERLAESAQSQSSGKKAAAGVQSPVVKSAQVRSIRFTGRFADVLAAIQELSQNQDPPGIPIALSMAEANHFTEIRDWTFLVWM